MHSDVIHVLGGAVQGQLLRRTARREVAIFLRDGVLWVADFIDGHGEIAEAATWFRFNCATRFAPQLRYRMRLEGAMPLSDDLARRIDALWPLTRQGGMVARSREWLRRIDRCAMWLALAIAACAVGAATLHERVAALSAARAAPTAATTAPRSGVPSPSTSPAAEAVGASPAAAELARPRECRLDRSIDTDCIFN